MAKKDDLKELITKEIIILEAKNEVNVTKRIDDVIKFLKELRAEIDTPAVKYDLSVDAGTHTTVAVTRDGQSVTAGSKVLNAGDVITVIASPANGYALSKFTINGVSAQSGDTVTVSSSVKIVTEAVAVYDLSITASNATVSVTRGGVAVTAGEEVLTSGDVLTISAEADSGYELTTFLVNGNEFTSGSTVTVSGDVTIVAGGTLIPEETEQQ